MMRSVFVICMIVLISLSTAIYPDHATWMGDMKLILYNKKLTDVILPGTHDSAAYRLDDAFAPGAELNSLLQDIVKLAKALHLEAPYDIIRNWALAQSADLYQQLMGGIRFFDLRAVYDSSTNSWRTDHILMGDHIDSLIQGVAKFVNEHPSEVVLIQVSHYAGVQEESQLDELAKIFEVHLQGKLFPRRTDFNFTIGDMVAAGQTVLVTGSQKHIYTANPYFWPDTDNVGVFEGVYANSDMLSTMEQHNLVQLQSFGGQGNLFQMFFTLTLQGAGDVEKGILDPTDNPHSLYTLASIANSDFDRWVKEQARHYQMPNILMTDFFENTTLIETVKRLNHEMDACIDTEQYRDPQHCRAWKSACSSDLNVQKECPLSCGSCSANSLISNSLIA